MTTKLTLSIDAQVIEHAKKFANLMERSLSNIVEEYLKSISKIREVKFKEELNPLVKSLYGSVKLPIEFKNSKDFLSDTLIKKYLK